MSKIPASVDEMTSKVINEAIYKSYQELTIPALLDPSYKFVTVAHLDALYATMRKQEEAIKVMRESLEDYASTLTIKVGVTFTAKKALAEADKILNGDSQNPDPSVNVK